MSKTAALHRFQKIKALLLTESCPTTSHAQCSGSRALPLGLRVAVNMGKALPPLQWVTMLNLVALCQMLASYANNQPP